MLTYIYIYRSPETSIFCITPILHAHIQNITCSVPWRPSLDKRKTALSRAAVQLFSVVKHVSVWQSKLLFQFAVPDTDRAFKIWREASHHCSYNAARDTGSYLPHSVALCLQMTLCMSLCCMQTVALCCTKWYVTINFAPYCISVKSGLIDRCPMWCDVLWSVENLMLCARLR